MHCDILACPFHQYWSLCLMTELCLSPWLHPEEESLLRSHRHSLANNINIIIVVYHLIFALVEPQNPGACWNDLNCAASHSILNNRICISASEKTWPTDFHGKSLNVTLPFLELKKLNRRDSIMFVSSARRLIGSYSNDCRQGLDKIAGNHCFCLKWWLGHETVT